MGLRDIEERLFEGVRADLEDAGVTLLDVEAHPSGASLLLRFVIDVEGGVTLDDCVRVDRMIGAFLMEDDFVREDHTVEVTSPGLDRRLKRVGEYDHFRGRRARIHLADGGDGPLERSGILEGTDEGDVLLDTGGETVRIPLEKIAKAKLLFEERKNTASGRKR